MSKSTKKKTEVVYKEKPFFFKFSSTLRIHGDGIDIDEISKTLGLTPTHSHRKGDLRAPSQRPWRDDAWHYSPPVERERPLHEHIMALWDAVRPHISYLRSLKPKFHVDIFYGYRSNSSTAGFEVDYRCLGLFIELEVPFGVSVIIS